MYTRLGDCECPDFVLGYFTGFMTWVGVTLTVCFVVSAVVGSLVVSEFGVLWSVGII